MLHFDVQVHIENTDAFQRFRLGYDGTVGDDKDLLHSLRLNYTLSWPLHLVFTDECFARYNVLFRFLLHTKRVQQDLHDCWLILVIFFFFFAIEIFTFK